MRIMAIRQIVILSALFAQTLTAPSGCIESCDFYRTSYQSRHATLGGYQDHAGLVQGSTNLNNYDYTRPGNWTERNQYNTDSGHGKVHEERGQYVEGSKRVRYYKKNFTSSYGTGNVDGETELSGQHRYDSLHIPSNQHFESQVGTQLGQVTKESGYSRMHSQQSSTRIDSKSERLEDFGEYGGHSQQHGVNIQTVETTPENWSRVDSHRTDGGHGRVFEEEGQYVSGPKKVRYYKKNYTSSYSTSGDAVSPTLNKLHSELQKNVHEELEKLRQDFHHHTASTTGLAQEAVHSFHSNDLQTAESENSYGQQQLSGYRRIPSIETVRHYTDQQQTEIADTGRQRTVYPIPTTYDTESQRTYQGHETYVSRAHPIPQSNPLSLSYPVQVTGGNYQSASYSHLGGRQVDEIQRSEISGVHQSGVAQNRLLTERVYNPNPTYSVYPGRRDETRHYQEEHWQSSSSHNGGNLAPERSADLTSHGIGSRAHYDRDAYNEQRGRYHSTAHGYDSRVGSSYSSGYGTGSTGQQLVAAGSSLDLGRGHNADCTEESHQHYQHESRYHRKYKRDVQQNQEFEPDSKQWDLTHASNQQSEDFTQHDEDFTQQTEGQLEFGQQTVDDQHLNDFTEQSEQAQQTQGSNHFTQTSDKVNFGQHIVGDKHLDDLTQQNEQFTQETEGQLEFGQQTVDNQHLTQHSEQFSQQESNDHTQQTSKLEFGQQIIGNQRLEDLTQQNEQFTQETEDQLEFGQQTVDNQHLTQHNEQLMQQDYDDLSQQSGKLEFGQQTVSNQHLENLKQQTEQFEIAGSDDYTQQTVGKLEFGQQTDDTQQQTEHFVQRATRSEDLTQQTSNGKLEFGQQTINNQQLEDSTQQIIGKLKLQSTDKPTNPKNQHLEEFDSEDFSQHTSGHDDFTQHTMGQLEFGQQQSNNPKIGQYSEDFTQPNEDLTQHVGGFDDFTQQGRLEYGQQREQSQKLSWPEYNTRHSEHFSQQDGWNAGDLSQQSYQYPSYSNNNEQLEWQSGMSQKTEQDFTQQTNDDDRQFATKPAPKPKPRQRYQKHDSISSHTDGTDTNLDDIFEPIEVNPEADIDNLQEKADQYSSRLTHSRSDHRSNILNAQSQTSSIFDNEKENMDRLHWLHKSNDATVGLQWHYTYHPSDLTNIESSHNSYPHHNVNSMSQQMEDTQQQQQSRPFDFSQQETQDKHTFEDAHVSQTSQAQHNEYNQQLGSFQQTETPHFDSQFNKNSEQTPLRVIPLQNLQQTSMQTTEQTEHKIESRILEAYGGGPYDASRNDDIYRRVTPNPSATLPPLAGEDPWDIREKPKEIIPWTVANTLPVANTSNVRDATTTEKTEITTQITEDMTVEAPPSFWSRLGHKITRTYDKAKEKAKEYFG
ncbi:uncharacterized protein LOC126849661 isoform X2 [Cataglyphis hispanica]|uniref:uncharacterized protein LOC126849661 isoform X2 n=1 Tax=Cataglyphis hispanica TaxID=1086592 RepID=UPI00217F365A|nr:uncharacterized protein LOC126849661 isoform X2 [Cataglyphis hispanica]